jgi:CheY-like chemotaxis protein
LPIVSRPEVPWRTGSKGATVLVVDDEDIVRKLACMALRRRGYEVLEAEDGKQALEILAGAAPTPALALVDLAMPVMGGDELVPILEKNYSGMKVVVTSGYPEEDARKAFQSGNIAGFLQKPYTVLQLAEKLGETLISDSNEGAQSGAANRRM